MGGGSSEGRRRYRHGRGLEVRLTEVIIRWERDRGRQDRHGRVSSREAWGELKESKCGANERVGFRGGNNNI